MEIQCAISDVDCDRDSIGTITLAKWLFRCAAPGTPMEKRVHAPRRAACATGRDGDMDVASRENSGRLRLGMGMPGFRGKIER